MPADSVLADFMSGLDSNISMLLYGLAPTSLDEAIMKAKMIEIRQKNASGAIQVNAKMTQSHQTTAPSAASITATATTTISAKQYPKIWQIERSRERTKS